MIIGQGDAFRGVAKGTILSLLFVVLLLVASGVVHGQTTPITALSLLPDGQIVTGSDDGLRLHNAETLEATKRITSDLEKIYSIQLSPDHEKIAVVGGTPAEFGVVEVFAVPSWQRLHTFEPFEDIATDCAWLSQDQLIVGSMTGDCCTISLTQEAMTTFSVHSKGVLSLGQLSSHLVVTGGLDHTIGIWDLEKQAMVRTLNNHVDIVNGLALRPTVAEGDSSKLAMVVTVSDDSTVRFWQPTIGRMVRFVRLESIPTCVLWNPAGTKAIVGTRSGQVHFIDPTTAKVTRTLAGTGWIHCLAISISQKSILVGGADALNRIALPEN